MNNVPTSIFHHIELRNAGETAESVSLVKIISSFLGVNFFLTHTVYIHTYIYIHV